jgi:F-type H+-transporting ATPase subunit gamma
MATLKDIQLKIAGIGKTKQITKAMNMVATSRLRGAQMNMDAFRPYAGKFAEVLGSVAEKAGDDASPLLIPRDEVQKVHIVLCTSDRGLCGGFNANLIDAAEKLAAEKAAAGMEVSFTYFGKKGFDWGKKETYPVADKVLGVVGSKFGFNVAVTGGRTLVDRFLDETYDEVYVIFSEFVSMAKQLPVVKQLLPIPAIEKEEEDGDEAGSGLPGGAHL